MARLFGHIVLAFCQYDYNPRGGAIGAAYFIPRQFLDPRQKGTYDRCMAGVTS